jgi:Helix-turn-helix domain
LTDETIVASGIQSVPTTDLAHVLGQRLTDKVTSAMVIPYPGLTALRDRAATGELIRLAREARRLTLTDAARASGLSPALLSLIEHGRRPVTARTAAKLLPVLMRKSR